MTNWHICEDPYPGPTRHMTMQEAATLLSGVGSEYEKIFEKLKVASKLVWDDYKSLWMGSWNNIEPIAKPEWAYGPYFDNSLMFSPSMTEEERREHALKCRQNRNTGPRRDFTYHHDGRRLI